MNSKFFVTFFAVTAIVSLAVAQAPGPGGQGQGRPGGQGRVGGGEKGGAGMGSMQLLRNPKVQEEINLTADQKQQLTKLMEGLGMQGRKPGEGQGGQKPEGGKAQMAELREKMQKAEAEIKNILTDEQEKRISQLMLQQQGAAAISQNQKIQEQLQLTQPQRVAIQEIQKQNRQNMQGLGQGSDRKEAGEKLKLMRTEMNDKILNILTPDQKSAWTAMLGKPFDFKRK